jgi:hypothetical protein
MWQREADARVAAAEQRHATEIATVRAEFTAKLTALQTELEQCPERVIELAVNEDVLLSARTDAETAWRARDISFAALSALRLLHVVDDSGKCRCGLDRGRCRTVEQFDGLMRALDKWEIREAKRLERGDLCRLPDNHPARIDSRRWAVHVAGLVDDEDEGAARVG